MHASTRTPLITPLGDSALLVRFGDTLDEAANRAAIDFAGRMRASALPEVVEIAPNLVSVLLRYDPLLTDGEWLAGGGRLLPRAGGGPGPGPAARDTLAVAFGGEGGPDLDEAAGLLGMATADFIAAHNAAPLRVLAIGFAPGFAYCGFHPPALRLPRRTAVRQRVPAGSILFAAGQTAIAATDVPTGWHVIGRTDFRNFDVARSPPVTLRPGDLVTFEAAA